MSIIRLPNLPTLLLTLVLGLSLTDGSIGSESSTDQLPKFADTGSPDSVIPNEYMVRLKTDPENFPVLITGEKPEEAGRRILLLAQQTTFETSNIEDFDKLHHVTKGSLVVLLMRLSDAAVKRISELEVVHSISRDRTLK